MYGQAIKSNPESYSRNTRIFTYPMGEREEIDPSLRQQAIWVQGVFSTADKPLTSRRIYFQ